MRRIEFATPVPDDWHLASGEPVTVMPGAPFTDDETGDRLGTIVAVEVRGDMLWITVEVDDDVAIELGATGLPDWN